MAQMLDLADKDDKVSFMCYRDKRKLFKELKRNILMSGQISLGREMKAK